MSISFQRRHNSKNNTIIEYFFFKVASRRARRLAPPIDDDRFQSSVTGSRGRLPTDVPVVDVGVDRK